MQNSLLLFFALLFFDKKHDTEIQLTTFKVVCVCVCRCVFFFFFFTHLTANKVKKPKKTTTTPGFGSELGHLEEEKNSSFSLVNLCK